MLKKIPNLAPFLHANDTLPLIDGVVIDKFFNEVYELEYPNIFVG